MRKFYYITSVREGEIVGAVAVAAYGGQVANIEQREAILNDLRLGEWVSTSFLDSLRDGEYKMPFVFTRAEGRKALKELNANVVNVSFFEWKMREVGEFKRDTSKKVKGWQVVMDGSDGALFRSAHNNDGTVQHLDGNIFKTREEARSKAKYDPKLYYVVPVYAD